MRAPPNRIHAPEFPVFLKWVNVPRVRWTEQRPPGAGRVLGLLPRAVAPDAPVHEGAGTSATRGPQVVGVHSAGFPPSQTPTRARRGRAARRSPIRWRSTPSSTCGRRTGTSDWPARYLFDQRGMLLDYHYGEGGYDETERAIQELLGIERRPLAPFRPEDTPGALLEPQTETSRVPTAALTRPAACGRCSTGTARSRSTGARSPSTIPARTSSSSTGATPRGVLELGADGVTCYAICFTPGRERGLGESGQPERAARRGDLLARRSSSKRRSCGGPSSSTSDAPRASRDCSPAPSPTKPAVVAPATDVDKPRAAGLSTRSGRRRAAARRDGCARRSDAPARERRDARATSPIARSAGAAQLGARDVGPQRPEARPR